MKVLAIETSWEYGGVCLLEEEEPVFSEQIEQSRAHGTFLGSLVNKGLSRAGWAPSDLNLVVVDRGPGSYTGLRVGITFSKTLAHCLDCPLTTATAHDVIADGVPGLESNLTVVINAEWNEVYLARYQRHKGSWGREDDITTEDPATVVKKTNDQTLLVGNGLEAYPEIFDAVSEQQGDREFWFPDPCRLGIRGFQTYREEGGVDLFSLQPMYLRPTQTDVDR